MYKRFVPLLIFILTASSVLCQSDSSGYLNLTVTKYLELTNNNEKLVLVNFSADWCVVCKREKPILDDLKKSRAAEVLLLEIDMEQNPLIAEHFEVDGLPVTLLYKNGKMVWNRMGFQSKEDLENILKIYSKEK